MGIILHFESLQSNFLLRSAEIHLGGPGNLIGKTVRLVAGDAVIIPAGVAHKRVTISGMSHHYVISIFSNTRISDFRAIVAYPSRLDGESHDLIDEKVERDAELQICTRDRVRETNEKRSPTADPVYGSNGPLMTLWKLK